MTVKQQVRHIKKNYLKTPIKTLAVEIGRSQTFVRLTLSREGLVIPKEIIEQRKRKSRFIKGHIPFNKGKKMPKELYEKVKGTMFKKGQKVWNERSDGDTRINVDGYIEIRISRRNWKPLHRVIWEKEHGKLSKNDLIQFKDGNPLNVDLDNLYLTKRSIQAIVNKRGGKKLPYEARKTVELIHKVKSKIHEKQNN